MPLKLNRSLVVTRCVRAFGHSGQLPRLTIFTGAPLLFRRHILSDGGAALWTAVWRHRRLGDVLPCAMLWGHPETACIVVAEALTVGWLARRRMHPTLADLIFWVAIGTPLAALFYIVILSYPSPDDWVMVVKHPVNGLLNVMVAELLISIPALQRLWGEVRGPAGAQTSARLSIARISAGGHGTFAAAEHRERRELCRAAGERSGSTSKRGGHGDAGGLWKAT